MKQLFLLATFFFVSVADAQYKPIANSKSTSWVIKHEICDRATTQDLHLQDTATIGSKKYFKSYLDNNGKHEQLIGYFREDATTGKAWFWGVDDTTEYLIMDLGLIEGDSIFVKMYGHDNCYAKVIASETINEGRVITTDFKLGAGYINEYLSFIEGVGPNASILFQMDDESATKCNSLFGFLVCKKYTDEELTYAWDPIHFDCGQMYAYTEEFQQSGIMVYPNPKSYRLKISSPDNLITEIYNTSGKCVLRSDEKDIMINQLKPQIYLVKIIRDNKTIHLARIVIESNHENERN